MITLHVKLNASLIESGGYITYVFEDLNYKEYQYQYIMCIRFPNWEQKNIEIGDVGYVTIKYVKAGIDEWFKDGKFYKFSYDNIIFLKFIHEKNIDINQIVVD